MATNFPDEDDELDEIRRRSLAMTDALRSSAWRAEELDEADDPPEDAA